MEINMEIIEMLSRNWEASRKQFAVDLKARIEIATMSPRIATPYPVIELKEVYRLIDETLNAEHPTPEQIQEIERGGDGRKHIKNRKP